MAASFTGRGIAYPMGVDHTGRIALSGLDDVVAESIRLILGTSPGERPMRPEFGCAIHDHVFEPADSRTEGVLAFEVANALRRWEPRIDVHAVDVAAAPDNASLLYIEISYSMRDTNDRRNLVFPFYVIPTEE
jgi:phage baseplate assembly protein W